MGIKYFYNFCIADYDRCDLNGDILSAVRKRYFDDFCRIRDRITVGSEDVPLQYEYTIEQNKPLKWTVKSDNGTVLQDVTPSVDGRYYLCFYRNEALYKRLLFSRLHTLLKAEYMDGAGLVCASVEPRKMQGGLCLLYESNRLSESLILSPAPQIVDRQVASLTMERFTDYSAVASTNEGIVYYLSDAQAAAFRQLAEQVEAELAAKAEESFIGDEAPLLDKINVKDFNVKRNLSSSLDISMAADFIVPEDIPEVAEADVASDEVMQIDADQPDIADETAVKPDKLIMADGAVYSYYGELDANGNRSGYGRTLTDLGMTAYEGRYENDKRSGKGAYFYKDGTLCYSGDWAQNARHGVGVGISARDGSIHVGNWKNNKPEGNGARLTAQGDIKFVCRELADGRTVLMNYQADDSVLITQYDAEGKKIAEKTVSLIDFDS